MTEGQAPVVRELGRGHPILVVHGGMSDESPWLRVARTMRKRFHVVLIRRRLYRLELPVRVEQTISEQVAEVLEVARGLGEPCVIVGHSSGAIIALEALAADPGPFLGGVLYEPPTPLPGLPLAEPTIVPRALVALAEDQVGRALQIYLLEGVGEPPWVGAAAPAMALLPDIRKFLPRQIDDLDSIIRLGVRTDTYADIDRPVWFLTGERSPAHLRRRCERLVATLPRADLVTLPGVGHAANQSNPRQLGELICFFAESVFGHATRAS